MPLSAIFHVLVCEIYGVNKVYVYEFFQMEQEKKESSSANQKRFNDSIMEGK